MNDIKSIGFSLHLLLTVMLLCCYIVLVVLDKDELEEKAQGYALKYSNLVTLVSLVLYLVYKAVTGNFELSSHVVLALVNVLCLTYFLFNFLYKKGIEISFKIKNEKIFNAICYVSTVISVITTITTLLKVKAFENPAGIIRGDTAVLMINFMIVSIMIGMSPKKKLSREEYKKREAEANKYSKIFTIAYAIFMVCMVGTIIYKVCTKK